MHEDQANRDCGRCTNATTRRGFPPVSRHGFRESLAIRVRRKLSSTDVIDVLTDPFFLRGVPA